MRYKKPTIWIIAIAIIAVLAVSIELFINPIAAAFNSRSFTDITKVELQNGNSGEIVKITDTDTPTTLTNYFYGCVSNFV
jgi:membrane protein YdbS with pleckstrin-like domain